MGQGDSDAPQGSGGQLNTRVAAALLGGAYVSQYGFGLYPCEMCWWQRYPHIAAIVLAVLALTIKGKEMEEEKQAMQEYGSSDSGASLGDILGAAIRRRNQMSPVQGDEPRYSDAATERSVRNE